MPKKPTKRRPELAPNPLDGLLHSVATWHLKKYGPVLRVGPTLRHLGEELGEFHEALFRGDDAAIAEEAADVALILLNIVRAVAKRNLLHEMVRKHEIVKRRR